MKLVYVKQDAPVQKLLILAAYTSTQLEKQEVPSAQHPDLKKLHDWARAPLLVTENDGNLVFPNVIARYLANAAPQTNMLGGSSADKLAVEQWAELAIQLEEATEAWMKPVRVPQQKEYDAKVYNNAKRQIRDTLKVLNKILETRTFLVGHRVSFADIAVATSLAELFSVVLENKFTKAFPNAVRWFRTCVNQPKFKAVLGEIAVVEKEKKAPAPKKQPKKQQQQQQKKKKEKHWTLTLPKTKMILDAVKKLYWSVPPHYENFFPEFWADHFDNEGWSFHTGTWKFNEDNDMFFKTENFFQGFIQRSQACTKFAFGVTIIQGETEDTPPVVDGKKGFVCKTMWLFRGDKVPEEEMMKQNPSAEYFDWARVDVTNDAGKKKVEEWFRGDTVDGMKVLGRDFFR